MGGLLFSTDTGTPLLLGGVVARGAGLLRGPGDKAGLLRELGEGACLGGTIGITRAVAPPVGVELSRT